MIEEHSPPAPATEKIRLQQPSGHSGHQIVKDLTRRQLKGADRGGVFFGGNRPRRNSSCVCPRVSAAKKNRGK